LKVIKKDEIKQTGRAVIVYSEPGEGKTTSILQSAPDPIFYIQAEPRNIKPALDAADRPDLDIEVGVAENFEELKKFLSNQENFERFNTIVVDSFSHLMNISLSKEIEDQAFEARSKEEQKKKPLVSQAKLSMEGYGGLASQMFRVTELICKLAAAGKYIIVTARLIENPKWDRALQAAPALKGREFSANMAGFFDLIGLVTKRVNKEGSVVYPPYVRFESPDDTFMAKFTGIGPKEGPLLFDKIFKVGS